MAQNRLILAVLMLIAVALPVSAQLVEQHGSDLTFDVATWNIRQFPDAAQTVNALSLMINDLEIELIGCQEITDDDALRSVASNAGGWGTVIGEDYYGLRHAVLYDADKVEVGSSYEIYTSYSYPFPRAPLVVPVTMVEAEDTLSFNFMVFHLKAGRNDSDDRARRAEAVDSLHAWVGRQIDDGNDRWMLVGDWNDDLDDPSSTNVFTPMLDDPDFHFLTLPIVDGGGDGGTWIPAGFFYDHLMVTDALYADFTEYGETEVLHLEDEYSQYENYISDHRPVATYFPTDALLGVAEDGVAQPAESQLSVWPVPANAMVTIGYSLPLRGEASVQLFDVLGRQVRQWDVTNTTGKLSWNAVGLPTGIYFVRLEAGPHSQVKRAVIVK
ncbi:T9SS type A sorting domain-containing protein [bacterium]|nr:T9SS type A sorting domain-containing protein [bacterium]